MSKLRIEKLKQGVSSNNDVLVFRNDLGQYQGQSNLVLTKVTFGTNTVNSSVYTGTAYLANSATHLNGQLASYYAIATAPDTAYSNAVSTAATDASTKAATAYSNATSYADTIAGTAYSNAVSTASSDATSKAATAYSNAISTASGDATTKAATAYSNAVSYADTIAATAYTNAVAYAASNTYVNTQLGYKANLTGATFTGAVSGITTLAAGNTTITGFANVSGSLTVGGDATITGNLVVNGNTITVNTTSINVTDSLLYLATNNEISDSLDIGFGAHYNAGSGANGHTGFVRSATTKKYYLFQNYQPELFANNTIDFANTATGIQMADLVVGNLVANSTLTVTGNVSFSNTLTLTGYANLQSTLAAGNTTVTGFINVSTSVAAANINTTGTVSADIITVSNVSQTQTNLQVDPAGSAFLNAIIYG